MRTRRSPRNQERLWKALSTEGPREPKPPRREPSGLCWDCRHYPKHGRSRGTCAKLDITVPGSASRPCFEDRGAPHA